MDKKQRSKKNNFRSRKIDKFSNLKQNHQIVNHFFFSLQKEDRLKKAVLVASDGDYACLVSFLKEKGVFQSLISPSNKCSFLLRKLNIPIVYLDMIKAKVMKRS